MIVLLSSIVTDFLRSFDSVELLNEEFSSNGRLRLSCGSLLTVAYTGEGVDRLSKGWGLKGRGGSCRGGGGRGVEGVEGRKAPLWWLR